MTAPGGAWPAAPLDHLMDLAEWDALPEDDSARFELVEGVMIASPRAVPRHQDLIHEIVAQLKALAEIEMVIDGHCGGPATVRVPDVVVATQDVMDGRPRAWGDEVLAAADYALVAVHESVAPLSLGGTQRSGADAPEAGYRVTLSL